LARSSPIGQEIISLIDEIGTDARIAAKSMLPQECAAWLQVGTVPLMARAAWADAVEMARQARELGQHVDVERVFREAMGPRAFGILMDAVGKKR
jgi:hypothetical protein